MATRMQQRRGTAIQWTTADPILAPGEIGFESDTNQFKIGDGINHWSDLSYFKNLEDLGGSLDDYILLSLKGNPNGVAELDADGKIPSSQIPSLVGLDSEITTAVNNAVTSLIDAAPGALNTLNELAAALNDDENFATTIGTNVTNVTTDFTSHRNNSVAHGTTGNVVGTTDTQTLTNKTISGASNTISNIPNSSLTNSSITISGVEISLGGSQSILTDSVSEGVNNLYFTNERAQDAVGSILGTGLTYNDASNTITVDSTNIQLRVANVSDTEIGYLDGVTSAIQTQLDSKLSTANLDEAAQDAINTALTAGTGITKTYDDVANTLTVAVDTTAIQARVTGVTDTEIGYLDGVTSAIQTQLDTKLATSTASSTYAPKDAPTFTGTVVLPSTTSIGTVSGTELEYVDGVTAPIQTQLDAKASSTTVSDHTSDTTAVHGISDTANLVYLTDLSAHASDTTNIHGISNTANLVYLTDLSAHASDTTDIHGIADTAELATKAFAASLLTGATKTNISITGDKNGLVITAENGVTDASTTELAEGTNLYFTDERAQDAVGNSVGTGLIYNDTTGAISVDTTAIQEKITGVSSTEIGYLDGVTSAIQTQINAKAAVSHVHALADISDVTSSAAELNILDGATLSTTELNYVDGVTSSIQTQLDAKQPAIVGVSNTEIGYLDGVTSSIQTQLDAKLNSSNAATTYAPLASPTFTGTVTLPANTISQSMMGDDSVGTNEIGGLAVTTEKLANSAVTEAKVADLAITSAKIANGTIVNGDINESAAIATSKISGLDTALAALAPIDSPTFTGTVSGITKSAVGLGLVDNTTDASKPVSTATQTALDAKANLAAPTFTGIVVLPSTTSIGDVSATELGYLDGVTSAIQTQITARLPLAGGTMTGALTLSGAPTSDLHAATKLYVDNVTAGINFHESVHVASTVNSGVIYNNGTAGVGATLTADTNRSISALDGESVVVGERILMKNQTDAKQNGIYVLTDAGSASTPWVMTRATDADNNPTGEMKTGDFTFVQRGTVNASVGYINNSTASPIVIGTSNISYTEFNAGKTVVAGNGLTETSPGIFAIDTAVTQTRVANVSDTEIGYLDGVTSAIQTQLNAKTPELYTFNATTGTTKTIATADAFKSLKFTDAGAITVTVPTHASDAIPVGTYVELYQWGGQITVVAATPATTSIRSTDSQTKSRTTYSSMVLIKVDNNEWLLTGDLTA